MWSRWTHVDTHPIRKRAMLRASRGATAKLNLSWLDMILLRLRLARVVAESQHVKSYQVHVRSCPWSWLGPAHGSCRDANVANSPLPVVNPSMQNYAQTTDWTHKRWKGTMERRLLRFYNDKFMVCHNSIGILFPTINTTSCPTSNTFTTWEEKHVQLHWFTLCHSPLCFQEVIDWNETWPSACHFHLWPSEGKVCSWNLWHKIHRNDGQCRQLWDRSWFKISIAKQPAFSQGIKWLSLAALHVQRGFVRAARQKSKRERKARHWSLTQPMKGKYQNAAGT